MTRILVIDDHATTREPLSFMLEQEDDFTVVGQAGSIEEARAAILEPESHIDVAVVDLGLPDGSGEELIPELRRVNPDASALVLTYFTEEEMLAKAVAAGATGILHKSASVQEVVDAVRRLAAGEALLTVDDVVRALRHVDLERQKEREIRLSFEKLTEREQDILQALADGLSDREIAERYFISPATVRTHVTNVLSKLNAASRLQALVVAVRFGIVTID